MEISKKFTTEDQLFFAEVSGDSNPIHCDRETLRHTQFDDLVVHGIHQLIWVLGEAGKVLPRQKILRDLQIEFVSPLYVDSKVATSWKFESFENISIGLTCESKRVTNIKIGFQDPVTEMDVRRFPKRDRHNHPTEGLEFLTPSSFSTSSVFNTDFFI